MSRSRKNKKGISEVGFFIELKNRHIIQRFPVAEIPRAGNASVIKKPPVSEPGEHKNWVKLRLPVGWGTVGQGRARRVTKSILAQRILGNRKRGL